MITVEALCLETAKLIEKIHQSNRAYRNALRLLLAEEQILDWIIKHHLAQQSAKQSAKQSK